MGRQKQRMHIQREKEKEQGGILSSDSRHLLVMWLSVGKRNLDLLVKLKSL